MSVTEIDKLTETFSLRIPGITKYMIDGLSKADKNKLNEAILITMPKPSMSQNSMHDCTLKKALIIKWVKEYFANYIKDGARAMLHELDREGGMQRQS